MKTLVILNEQHKLMEEQVEILNAEFDVGGWEICSVPADGWTYNEIYDIGNELIDEYERVVFASPVPALLSKLCFDEGYNKAMTENDIDEKDYYHGIIQRVFVFHNDRRVKKTLPNGKVISTVAEKGWRLV